MTDPRIKGHQAGVPQAGNTGRVGGSAGTQPIDPAAPAAPDAPAMAGDTLVGTVTAAAKAAQHELYRAVGMAPDGAVDPEATATGQASVRAVGAWTPKQEAPDATEPERGVYTWVQNRIEASVQAIFARRKVAPVVGPRARTAPAAPAWNPATAGTNGDGSLEPPRAQPTTGAPAPGQGKVSPTGLTGGNSVVRFGESGDPSNFTVLDQGSTNGCGTTSLAMMLNYMAGGKPLFDREKVDHQIRHFNMFTSPGDIAAYAERHGLEASVHTDSSIADLRRMIDQGLPVQVLLDVEEAHDGTGLHYEVVTGYGTGPDGKRYIELANPWGQREYMAEDAFLARWSDIKAKGFPLGINRVAIAMKPAGHPARLLPDQQGSFFDTTMTGLRVAQGLTQVTSGWARRDPATLTGGLFRLIAGGLVAIPTLLANAAGRWGSSWWSQGKAQLGGGFANTVRGLGKMAVGGLAVVATKPVEVVGNMASRGIDLVASGASGLVRGAGKVLSSL